MVILNVDHVAEALFEPSVRKKICRDYRLQVPSEPHGFPNAIVHALDQTPVPDAPHRLRDNAAVFSAAVRIHARRHALTGEGRRQNRAVTFPAAS